MLGKVVWIQVGKGEVHCREELLSPLIGWFGEVSDRAIVVKRRALSMPWLYAL